MDSVPVEHLENAWGPTRRATSPLKSTAPSWQQPQETSPRGRAAAQPVPPNAGAVQPAACPPPHRLPRLLLQISGSFWPLPFSSAHSPWAPKAEALLGPAAGRGGLSSLFTHRCPKVAPVGSPTLLWVTISNGEEQDRPPKPAGTEPCPRARRWSPSRPALGVSAGGGQKGRTVSCVFGASQLLGFG